MKSENLNERGRILLSAYSSLVGAIIPNLRAIFIDWDEVEIRMYFVFDGSYSEDDQEEMECIATEVLSDFPDRDIRTNFMSIASPERISIPGTVCIFARKERL